MDIAKLGFQVDSRPVDKANKRLDDFARTGRKAAKSTDRMSASSRRLDRAMSTAARGGIRNASYQIADVAVQMSMGTSAMRAMAIQLPQLLAGFGVMGAVLGAVAAIGGAIAPVLFKSGDAAGSAANEVSRLGEALLQMDRTAEVSAQNINNFLVRSFSASSDAVMKLIADLKNVQSETALTRFKTEAEDALSTISASVDGVSQAWVQLLDMQRKVEDGLLTQTQANRYTKSFQEIILDSGLAFDEVTKLDEALSKLGSSATTDEFVANLADAKTIAEDLGGPVADSVVSGLVAMADKAGVLSLILGKAADNAASIGAGLSDTEFNQLFAYQQYAATRLAAPTEPPKPRRQRSEGRRSPVDTLAAQYERLRGQIDPVWRATKQYEDAVSTLDRALSAGLIATQEEYNALLELTKSRFGEVGDGIKNLQSIAKTMESSMTDAFMAMVDGTKTAQDAFADMAKAIVKKLYEVLVVQQIVGGFDASTGTGSGIVGSILGGLFGGARADGGPVAAGRTYLVGERGPELFTPRTSGQIVPNGGSIVVNQYFSLSANGDESVKKIIAAEAPKIVNATKRAIIEARAAGGQMRTVFS